MRKEVRYSLNAIKSQIDNLLIQINGLEKKQAIAELVKFMSFKS